MEFKIVNTPVVAGQTKQAVRKAAAKAYPGYAVASVTEQDDKWVVRLDQLSDKVSSSTRTSAPPPFEKKDDADTEEPDEGPEDEPADEEAAEEDSEDAEGKGDKKDEKGDSKKKDPVAAIEGIMGELKTLLDQLGGHASDLKEKADKVDEVHELTKGDVPDVDSMEGVPAVPPLDDAGPTPGSGPLPPKRPPVPTGKGPMRPPAGVPGVFGSRNSHVVEHPTKDADGVYSLTDFLAAIEAHPDLQGYKLEEVKVLEDKNLFVGKVVKKN